MKILGIGNDGQGHAMARAITSSPHEEFRYAFWAPGSPGINKCAQPWRIDEPFDVEGMASCAQWLGADLVVVSFEQPLAQGLVDRLAKLGIPCAAPSREAAQIGANKAVVHSMCRALDVPMPRGEVCFSLQEAHASVNAAGERKVVVKATGLTEGRGVFMCANREEAHNAVDRIMQKHEFGEVEGQAVVIQEYVSGHDVSLVCAVNGTVIVPLTSVGHYKQTSAGELGRNTGGMGAHSPSPYLTPEMEAGVVARFIHPVLCRLEQEGTPYKGILGAHMMLTEAQPLLLGFTLGFGEPEAEVIITRLDPQSGPDLLTILQATTNSDALRTIEPAWKPERAVCVVAAVEGYPDEPIVRGDEVVGINTAKNMGAFIFQAGTTFGDDGRVVTNDSRVLVVSALGLTYQGASNTCYRAMRMIHWPGAWCRLDIGLNLDT